MSQESKAGAGDEMRPEYDIRGGQRGKYFARFQAGRAGMADEIVGSTVEIAPSPYLVTITGTSMVPEGLTRAYWPLTIQESPKVQVGEINGRS